MRPSDGSTSSAFWMYGFAASVSPSWIRPRATFSQPSAYPGSAFVTAVKAYSAPFRSPWRSMPMPQSFQRSRSAFWITGSHFVGVRPSPIGSCTVDSASTMIGRFGISPLIFPDTFFGMFAGSNEYSRPLYALPTSDGSCPGFGCPA